MVCSGGIRLATWKVSYNSSEREEFQTNLPNTSVPLGGMELKGHMDWPVTNGRAGVTENKLIQFQLL